ncbi:TonB-dependent receptor plug domain-containing protein [Chromobacterium subtsugae]|nr:TonB-dependent receptor [Chromobacterium subtsugae]OBU87987.1 hypothetical protein MY55_03560 [Chromobacterium subtsugae]WSE91721.1 TonB-dependent receptor [Chromobacterium subtsugae]WVH60095.1 TonB-dependent receptor [Chromobacterium subtsugae]
MNKGKMMRIKILAQAIAAFGLMGGGFAHAADGSDSQLERVTITGSNIKRISKEGALPVEVLKREDIEKTGASTTVQLLDNLTSSGSVLSGTNSASFAAGAATAGLRGMSSKYVLVLINGRRLPNYAMFISGTDSFVDLNTIPLAMIDSVEILRDGASAIYGSDAVAGVINFKTKRNFQGVKATTRYGQTEDGDGMEQGAGLMGGIGDLSKDGQNFMWSFDAYHREPVFASKHEPTKTLDYRRFGGKDSRSGTLWGSWKDYSNGKFYNPLPGCPKSLVTLSNGNTICPSDNDELGTQLSPRTSRYGLNGNYTKRIGSDSELFVEASVNRSQTSLDGGYAWMSQVQIKNGNAAYPTNPATLAAMQALYPQFTPGDTLQVTRSLYELGKSMVDVTADTYRVVAGGTTTIGDWDFEGSVNLGESKVTMQTSNAILNAPFMNMLQNGAPAGQPMFDPFAQNNQAGSLTPYATNLTNSANSKLQMLELKTSKSELAQLPGGPLGFAAGVQWWHESIESSPDALIRSGSIMNYAAQQGLQSSRSVAAAYAELSLPVIKNLEAQLAVRADHYNDFGDTVNPKFAFSYRPWQQVMFRGSATSAFKAPSLPQLYASRQAYQSIYDYAQCADKGISTANCTSVKQQIRSGGNPNLKAETNKSYGLGVVLQPMKELSASIDWYKLDQKDTIQALPAQYVVDHPELFPGYVVRKPSGIAGIRGDIDYISTPYANAGKTITSGIDIDVQYDLSLGGYGKLSFREQQTRYLTYQDTVLPTDSLLENVDYGGMPRWKNLFTVDYRYDKYSAAITARSYAGYKNAASPRDTIAANVPQRVPSYTAFDLNFGVRPLKTLEINGGIRNVGNRVPPYAAGASLVTFSGPSTDLWGRTYYITADYKF